MRSIILAALIVCLLGCNAMKDYRFGDITRVALQSADKVVSLKAAYCSDINIASREVILATIRHAEPEYTGICDVD